MASCFNVETLRMLLSEPGLPTDGFKPALVEHCRANAVVLRAHGDRAAPARAGALVTAATSHGQAPSLSDPSSNGPVLATSLAAPVEVSVRGMATADAASTASSAGAGTCERLTLPTSAFPAVLLTLATSGGPSGVNTSAGPRVETTLRAPQFTKHEQARLARILCASEVAAGVVTSRGVMPRQQQKARISRGSV